MKQDDPSDAAGTTGFLARQVHDILSEMLLSGRLQPDDRMSMRELAERMGVSVIPVRRGGQPPGPPARLRCGRTAPSRCRC